MLKQLLTISLSVGTITAISTPVRAEALLPSMSAKVQLTEETGTYYVQVHAEAGQRIIVSASSMEADPYVAVLNESGAVLLRDTTEVETELGISELAINDDLTAAVHATDDYHLPVTTDAGLVTAPVPYTGTYTVVVGSYLSDSSDQVYLEDGWQPNPIRTPNGVVKVQVTLLD